MAYFAEGVGQLVDFPNGGSPANDAAVRQVVGHVRND
jgi:hypothetical protein